MAEKSAILVVSFGTSYHDSREATIGAIEREIAETYPEYEVRRAFTSGMILQKLETRDHIHIDNVQQALDAAAEAGVTTLIVQPTHMMNGTEYHKLAGIVEENRARFRQVAVGEPLLMSDRDFERVADALGAATKDYIDGGTAVCYMGHGTDAASNSVYERLQRVLTSRGIRDEYVGTVEATPTLDDTIALVRAGDYRRVVLMPLMVVAGDHANNDMAGEDGDSWKSRFEAAGYQVECVVHGLGELPSIRALYADHVRDAMDSLQEGR